MKSQKIWFIAAIIAAAVLTSVMTASANLAMQARPTAVGVVDVMRLVEGLQEKPEIEAELKVQQERVQQEFQDMQAKLKRLEEDLGLLSAGSDAHTAKLNEAMRLAIEADAFLKFSEKRLNREYATAFEGLYRKMVDAAGKVASENGYDLVLYKDRPVSFANADAKQLRALFSLQKVLWSRTDMDLTDQVVLRMNNEYENNVK